MRWPVLWSVRWQPAIHRIDTEGKQLIECRSYRCEVKESSAQQVPIESFEMAHVKNNPVPLRYRPVVIRLRPHGCQQRIRLRTRIGKPLQQRLRLDDSCSHHTNPPVIGCRGRETGAQMPVPWLASDRLKQTQNDLGILRLLTSNQSDSRNPSRGPVRFRIPDTPAAGVRI